MALHVVGFTDIVRFEGNSPNILGRKLLMDYYDTAKFKSLLPGDTETPYSHRPWDVIEFVSAEPFNARLTVTDKYSYGGPYVTLHDSETNTYYPMFYADFVSMAGRTVVNHGTVSGQFGYVKKNKNFGIIFLGENENG